ncbi:hypothetical protein [Natronocalculus amylovorans]|uniref:Uncharacterized protein n=1 Tax=Natronocalculus amylovorans TaxID=2917812 RepID=A0AAE3FWJ4_9EURY|nr:hypothetical protein [Natronocalculus amylovorans]MCL9816654.1 hypothetical protein [Natronocalculus amylovorans]NUE01097.1 hypothetical protein [Halorubraceae archaeon YAN]
MAPAIVHFAVGFVIGLFILSILPITRYRLTGAFLAGVWGVVPDVHHIMDNGARANRVYEIHNSQISDIFFFHYTLDRPFFRDLSVELTFLSFAALGLSFLIYDWRFGTRISSREK